MKEVTILGIDLAKSSFQLHGNNKAGKTCLRRKVSRSKLPEYIANLPLCIIAMEACGSAYYWANRFKEMGHEVRLISPQFVKPFVKTNKNDSADAEAIAEAAMRPNMHFVPIKNSRQIDLSAIHRVRRRLVKNKTALINEIRSILFEVGLIINQGPTAAKNFARSVASGEHDEFLTQDCKITVTDLYQELLDLEDKIGVIETRLQKFSKNDDVCKRLLTIPGIGMLTATAIIAATPDPFHFKNGRQYAAWLGLVPKHTGTGGKNKILGISKRGDKYLRYLFVQGARSVVTRASNKNDKISHWINSLNERKHGNKVCVALANKNARIVLSLLQSGEEFKKTA